MGLFQRPHATGISAAKMPTRLFQIATEKLAQALAFGVVEYLGRGALFFDQTLMQKHHVAGYFARKVHFVGHHDHGAAFFGQPLNDP